MIPYAIKAESTPLGLRNESVASLMQGLRKGPYQDLCWSLLQSAAFNDFIQRTACYNNLVPLQRGQGKGSRQLGWRRRKGFGFT